MRQSVHPFTQRRGWRWLVGGLLFLWLSVVAHAESGPNAGRPGRGRAAAHVSLASVPLPRKAAMLNQALGRPARLLIGLGTTDAMTIVGQGIHPDIYDQYINGVGTDSWVHWNQPAGAYLQKVIQNAEMLGAVPMFTLYQMAARGDGDLSGLNDAAFMGDYWRNVHLLFQKLGEYGHPVLVNLEPDFWGYAQRLQPDPSRQPAQVRLNSDCPDLPDSVTGVLACLIQTAHRLAPQTYVGIPPSLFVDLQAGEPDYLQRLGAGKADFMVMQTQDRDAGCMEAQDRTASCVRNGKSWYWDEDNRRSPNFREHFAMTRRYAQALQLPVLWWQTPLGVPGDRPTGSAPWRDNRVRYFLTHARELVDAGGFGVVFSPGEKSQTRIDSDGGQFRTLSKAYLAQPAKLP